jgi:cation diffusion facilitator CzcD-associated flavoprotein CzcO
VALQDTWAPHPEAYLSLCTPKFHNLLQFLGPNGSPTGGSFIALIKNLVSYLVKCVKKMQREHIASMEVSFVHHGIPTQLTSPCSKKAHRAFSAHVDRYFEKTIFTYKV